MVVKLGVGLIVSSLSPPDGILLYIRRWKCFLYEVAPIILKISKTSIRYPASATINFVL